MNLPALDVRLESDGFPRLAPSRGALSRQPPR